MLDTLSEELHSPCVGICVLKEDDEICQGCARTASEIEDWGGMTAEEKVTLWSRISSRREKTNLGYNIAPLSKRQIGEQLDRALDDPNSVFSAGTYGALAEFSRSPDEPFQRFGLNNGFGIETERGALAFRPLASFKGFEFENQLVLAVHCKRAAISRSHVIHELGPDRAPLLSDSEGGVLFDLGLGAYHIDFCVRTNSPSLTSHLRNSVGKNIFTDGAGLWDILKQEQPDRVVVTQLARIEVRQPIPQEDGVTPLGPHTHLLPELLAQNLSYPPETALPKTYFPGLSLYRSS